MPKRRLEDRDVIPDSVFVAFSKRRRGLFNKAKELCVKFGAQIAIVVLSPTGKPFAYGHSSVDQILAHYLGRRKATIFDPNSMMITDQHKHQMRRIEDLKLRLKKYKEKKNVTDHEENRVLSDLNKWIEKEFEEHQSLQDLELLKQKFLALLDKITTRLESGTGGGDNNNYETTLDNDHYMMSTINDQFTLENSDFVLSCSDLHGDVGVFDFDDALDAYPLNDMSYAHRGSDSGDLNVVPPLNDLSYMTNYGSDSGALDVVPPLNDMSYVNYGSNSGAFNVHPLNDMLYYNNYGSDFDLDPLNDMSYNNNGSNSSVVGLLGNHIPGDTNFCFTIYDLLDC